MEESDLRRGARSGTPGRPARAPLHLAGLAGLVGLLSIGLPLAAPRGAALPPPPTAEAASRPAEPASPPLRERSDRVVSYVIEASLDHPARTVRGVETVTWRNTTSDPIADLQLHLYLNAFKNERTTFMEESRGWHRRYRIRDGHWGYIDLERLELADGRDLLAGSEFIRPDDANPHDETVLRVPLPEPVRPGETITFKAEFASRLPRVFARTGYKNDFYLVAQWFPKLGVYEEAGARGRAEGGWNCHQFHRNSEFYADFGTYDVTIRVPSAFVVGATGSLAEPPRSTPGGTTSYRYVQEDVHDFAWTADPDFILVRRTFSYAAERDPEEERRMARILGLDGSGIPLVGAADLSGVPEAIRLGDVEVTLLIQPEHRHQIDRHFRAVFNGIRYFGYWYGRYPYRTLTVVDPAYGGDGAGGMEYPTLITAGTAVIAPSRRLSPDNVTIHEYGHQHWYGLVANNEFEEPWLDEGINTYATGKVLEKAYAPDHDVLRIAGVPFVRFPLMEIPVDWRPGTPPPDTVTLPERLGRFFYMRWTGASNDSLLNAVRDLPFLTFPSDVPVPYPWRNRREYLDSGPEKDELLRRAWEFYDHDAYYLNSYDKSVLTLRTLESVLGEDTVARALRVYSDRYRFRHPTTDQFIATVSEVAGRETRWYFDQTLHGSGLLDYAIDAVESGTVLPGAGVYGPPRERRTVSRREARSAAARGEERRIEVIVRREGEVRLPVEIELVFEGGRREVRRWDGQYRWHRLREVADEELLYARVGPPGGHPLDVNWSNDARAVRPDRWPALKWWMRLVAWAQNVLHFYAGIA